jgi:3-(methylthio)propanoyl-CoA dehydrogenase
MGKTIDRHEMIADYLDEMRTDIQGCAPWPCRRWLSRGDGPEDRLAIAMPDLDEPSAARLERTDEAHQRRRAG